MSETVKALLTAALLEGDANLTPAQIQAIIAAVEAALPAILEILMLFIKKPAPTT